MSKYLSLPRVRGIFRHCTRSCISVVKEPDPDLLQKATVRPFVLLNHVDNTLKERDYFGFKKMITVDDLFYARVHYGHKILETHPAVREATKMVIPTVGIVDSNADPTSITYPVPGNDDSIPSVQYFMDCFVKAIKIGKEARQSLPADTV